MYNMKRKFEKKGKTRTNNTCLNVLVPLSAFYSAIFFLDSAFSSILSSNKYILSPSANNAHINRPKTDPREQSMRDMILEKKNRLTALKRFYYSVLFSRFDAPLSQRPI